MGSWGSQKRHGKVPGGMTPGGNKLEREPEPDAHAYS
jgi:hypothetical protein